MVFFSVQQIYFYYYSSFDYEDCLNEKQSMAEKTTVSWENIKVKVQIQIYNYQQIVSHFTTNRMYKIFLNKLFAEVIGLLIIQHNG